MHFLNLFLFDRVGELVIKGVNVFYLLDFCGSKDLVVDFSHKARRYDNLDLVFDHGPLYLDQCPMTGWMCFNHFSHIHVNSIDVIINKSRWAI